MRNFPLLIFTLLLIEVILILPDETRNEFFKKYAKSLSQEIIFEEYLEKDSIPYEKEEIDNLIKKYNFPESYNFINDTNPSVHVKNQENCGCCWAMSSTTCLAYRYHKIGIEVDLSPQHELSCYLRSCPAGNYLIDPQLSLIKNGTITEECLPFSSGDEKIEDCPINTCKNPDVEYKKYFAKNAYYIEINQNNFYDVTALIIDQLITKGPVVTAITAYGDFVDEFGKDENCTDKVYNYDGISDNRGGHAISLVGYGFLNDKYYWLIQNSWGDAWCKDGFGKIEFGQVGIGDIAFSEPYLEEEEEFPEVINVSYVNMDNSCKLEINTNSNLSNWKSQLNIIFEHSDESKEFEFDYFCGVNKLITENETKIYCNYELNNKISYKGLYKYKSFESIGKENTFALDKNFEEKNFYYYGNDNIEPFSKLLKRNNIFLFVSEKGSRISFLFKPSGIDKNISQIGILYNSKIIHPLNNCNKSTISNPEYIVSYCDINEKDLNYFEDFSKKRNNYLLLRYACGQYKIINIFPYKLDKSIYPVFRIKHFVASYNKNDSKISMILYSNVEGSLSSYKENNNIILIFIEVIVDDKTQMSLVSCPIGTPKNIGPNYAINCTMSYSKADKIDKVLLYPYYDIYNFEVPFEVIISDIMENEDYVPPEPSPIPAISDYLKLSSISFILFSLLLILV